MSTKIKGAEYQIAKIFSSDFDYNIPSFQRPYSWTEEETGELFDDLYEFYESEGEEEQYFLGSIVLVKEDDKPHAEVIDGQQRLTTLTILMAVIASRLLGEDRNDFKSYIIEPGRASQGIASKPRLRIRKRDRDFFKKYIQEMDFDGLFKLNPETQDTEAKGNIIRNAKLLMDRMEAKFEKGEDIVKFGSFIVTRCLMVAVSTSTEQTAFRIFSVMNNRGMSLLATDIIKADVIGAINDVKQRQYNEKWEELEVGLGRNGFHDLFGHIRMIKTKVKAKKSLQEEFYKYVLPDVTEDTAIDFIENTLEPFSEAYNAVKNIQYAGTTGVDDVNNILQWLNRIDNSDWVPVAMLYYVKHKDDAVALCGFLRKLERLAVFLRTVSSDVNHRIDRYAKILIDIESEKGTDYGNNIELTDMEKKQFLDQLNSDVYRMVSIKRNYLILRLDSFVSDGAASYNVKRLTIEHVLPQTVAQDSQWATNWPDVSEREQWLHKIGNIIPLSKIKNSQAQNYEFDVKKEKYFKGKTGTASYALTTQVLSYDKWTPEIVKQRQAELIKVYRENWEL